MVLFDIADSVDYILTKWKFVESNFDYVALLNTLIELNSSFATSFADTDIIATSPLQLDGDKLLRTVNYLRKGPSSRSVSPFFFQNRNRDYLPETFSLEQNYPNPFNPLTVIRYSLSDNSAVMLKVYDILGKEVVTLLNNEETEAGEYEINFDATNLPSGVYFYRLSVSQNGILRYNETKKLMLMK
ncbi:MAG: T9SS type A sorting domain-containing protein [Ignavibacteria bacterium]|nr:T9SS type A sorting domain-containing protein [Ignavibacteria bacterium]